MLKSSADQNTRLTPTDPPQTNPTQHAQHSQWFPKISNPYDTLEI